MALGLDVYIYESDGTYKNIKDLIIDIPSIEEQTKISMLLNNVNSIITLHQRKLEHLQLQKKALLQQMFV